MSKPVRIDVVSDLVCPWCFIGKKRLEKAVAMTPGIPVEVHFRPEFRTTGSLLREYLASNISQPNSARLKLTRTSLSASGLPPPAKDSVYAGDRINRQPNTRNPHRLIRWAEGICKAPEMKQRLMDLYFTEGADLSNTDVLVQAAAYIGLDPAQVRSDLASDKDVTEVEQEVQMAKDAGIQSVPMFIFGGKFAVSGAQAPEDLAQAIARAAAD